MQDCDIHYKANRVLNFILVAMIMIVLRVWHLAVIQHDEKLEESRKPQNRTIVEPAKRGTIRDRFNIPFAINKIQYNAAILYSQIRHIPSVAWGKDEEGNKVRKFKRRDHIAALAGLLAKELDLEADRVEDLIHSKASLFNHLPFVIKEDISEETYYHLKMLEKDWPGICVERVPKRHYPYGRLASDIMGYIGAINREEYEKIVHEMGELKEFLMLREQGEDLPFPRDLQSLAQVNQRLKDLEEHAYGINDLVGKTGIEGKFEEQLRGFHGRRSYYSDARGNFLRELPGGKEPLSGQRILLSISAELQQFAEQLLMENEPIRKPRISGMSAVKQARMSMSEPWIKGGAIVIMDPNSGDVLAMASYPRTNPNDFVASGNAEEKKKKRANILRWFESEAYLGEIWDRKRPLEREVYDAKRRSFYDEELWISWEQFLSMILPRCDTSGEPHEVLSGLRKITSIEHAIRLQRAIDKLMDICGHSDIYALLALLYPEEEHVHHGPKLSAGVEEGMRENLQYHQDLVTRAKAVIGPYLSDISHNYHKALLIDLCRVAVNGDLFSRELIAKAGSQSLSDYKHASSAWVTVNEVIKQMAKPLFHEFDFVAWRQEHGKAFLKEKRLEEKAARKYAKPYLDYFDKQEREMFDAFWEKQRWSFSLAFLFGIAPDDESPYLKHFLAWQKELAQGAHQGLEWHSAYETLVESLQGMESNTVIAYLQTLRGFQELDRPLLGQYRMLRKQGNVQLEKHLAAAFYPKYGFGYGRSYAFRQATQQGSLFKLVTAYEGLVERYRRFECEETKVTLASMNPLEIVDEYNPHGRHKIVGYHRDGSPIHQLYKGGRIPKTAMKNVGEVDLFRALECSSNPYFALLAGDILEDPENLADAARLFSYGERTGLDLPMEIKGSIPNDISENKTGLYAFAIGQHAFVATPMQSAVMLSTIANGGKVLKPKIINLLAGSHPRRYEEQISRETDYAYRDSLALMGIDFPLFTEFSVKNKKNRVTRFDTEVRREIFMPSIVRKMLLTGVERVMERTYATSITALKMLYQDTPRAVRDLQELRGEFIGKSSTSETVENVNLDPKLGTHKFNHIWFGGVSFEKQDENTLVIKDEFGKPELIVIVYLRYGEWGKDASPVAAQMVKKWREIKAKM